mmetsp:Transcript_9407/g.24219  ORF Transcript_9407/g.24219 Transcript_9407/m.24219 type:complete len:279 (-) Transcript_9407:34-870(-)
MDWLRGPHDGRARRKVDPVVCGRVREGHRTEVGQGRLAHAREDRPRPRDGGVLLQHTENQNDRRLEEGQVAEGQGSERQLLGALLLRANGALAHYVEEAQPISGFSKMEEEDESPSSIAAEGGLSETACSVRCPVFDLKYVQANSPSSSPSPRLHASPPFINMLALASAVEARACCSQLASFCNRRHMGPAQSLMFEWAPCRERASRLVINSGSCAAALCSSVFVAVLRALLIIFRACAGMASTGTEQARPRVRSYFCSVPCEAGQSFHRPVRERQTL